MDISSSSVRGQLSVQWVDPFLEIGIFNSLSTFFFFFFFFDVIHFPLMDQPQCRLRHLLVVI